MNVINKFIYLAASSIDTSPLPKPNIDNTIPTLLSIVFGIVGGLSLLFITLSGFRYITSAGDPQKIAKAKNGILYALVGIVVAISAQVIVAFLVGNI